MLLIIIVGYSYIQPNKTLARPRLLSEEFFVEKETLVVLSIILSPAGTFSNLVTIDLESSCALFTPLLIVFFYCIPFIKYIFLTPFINNNLLYLVLKVLIQLRSKKVTVVC